jgi:nucleotide-binding universal stress UspA family protein
MAIKSILVPLDGSPAAEAILPYVERIATATSARIQLLAAVDKPRDWGADTDGDLKGEQDEAESYLQRLQAQLSSATGSDVVIEVAASSPAGAILAACEAKHPDLVAMTTHGRSGVARWVLGSVASKVLHATTTPLLVARPPAEDGTSTGVDLNRILVPLDGSDLASSVLPFVADLAKPLEASVLLFQAINEPAITYPGSGAVFDDTTLKEMEAAAREYLKTAAEGLISQGVKTDIAAALGNTTDAIAWAAERERADIIAMSTHGRSGVGRLVLGSVADSVVRRTTLPVIVVRPETNRPADLK